jgi:hypothetical protein
MKCGSGRARARRAERGMRKPGGRTEPRLLPGNTQLVSVRSAKETGRPTLGTHITHQSFQDGGYES